VGAQALRLLGEVVRVGSTVSSLLGGDVSAASFASPVEFDSITGSYRIVDGIATTRDLVYTSRAMKVTVAGDYVLASDVMNLDVGLQQGRNSVRAKVTGSAASPVIRIVPGSVLRGIDQDRIERELKDLLRRFR
jgi:uncharacterized protein YhdP